MADLGSMLGSAGIGGAIGAAAGRTARARGHGPRPNERRSGVDGSRSGV